MHIQPIDKSYWQGDLPAFKEQTAAFFAGELKRPAYKGFSGYYGSYAQRDGKYSMLRLRMPAGRVTNAKLQFVAKMVQEYKVPRMHFTTCQTIQLHDLEQAATCEIMEKALDVGIVTLGGGGDFPRNVMCSPLSGVEPGEYFDVLPYAEAAGNFLMHYVKATKMPRKLKVGFSNSPLNIPHATFRDLGFVARPDGKFDVYSAGGLGNNPRFGVKVAEAIAPTKILYYIQAMRFTFLAYGNYNNRGKARTRYMQESLGGPEAYKAAYLAKLDEVLASGEDLELEGVEIPALTKEAVPAPCDAIEQKQKGLYAVHYHPLGGQPQIEVFCQLAAYLADVEAAELRLCPDESCYIINLTAAEAAKVTAIIAPDTAKNPFENSVACIGASTCQQGLRDSQALLRECLTAVNAAGVTEVLPQIHISGCPSSCGTHQIGHIGFRGAAKLVDKKPQSAFNLYADGSDYQGQEIMGKEYGAILQTEIPNFLVDLGKLIAASGKIYSQWHKDDPEALEKLIQQYI